ncbi:hypothetical protein EVG20_g10124 [Dentipellis fragilis]|uniref:DDE Tnp4 domain-containing protein n=1 Tax=Dentipellis fragilis TaxID=205917 RepID=A0A4Y9XVM9_9AGAM|nr:hypothetical protein EVG20_g10124 [Dentipellis fragilis]
MSFQDKLKLAVIPLLHTFTCPSPLSTSYPIISIAVQNNETLATYLTYFEACEEEHARARHQERMQRARAGGKARALPKQGGQRISREWLSGLSSQDAQSRFHLRADEIFEMLDALDIEEDILTRSRYKFSGLEALCLMLACFRSSGELSQLAMLYNRSPSTISEIVNYIVLYIDERWWHLLEFDHAHLLSPENLVAYASAIHHAGAPLEGKWQRQAYSGYKHYHALKFQAIMLPNGLFGHLFGPYESCHHDPFLLSESQIVDKCAEYATRPGTNDHTPAEQRFLQIFGDPAYGVSHQVVCPFGSENRTEEQTEWNATMLNVRIEVEHGFGLVLNTWPFLNSFWKMRVYGSPVGAYYRVGVLFTNILNCLRPNQVSQRFDLEPPLLKEYLYD